MNHDLAFEWRILGGSAQEALMAITKIKDPDTLRTLLQHEESHYRRKTVRRGIERRLAKLVKQERMAREISSHEVTGSRTTR